MEEEDNDPVLTVVKWEDFLQDYSKDGDYIHGYVTNETSVDTVLELYRRAAKTTFCTRRSSSLQFDPLKCKNKKFCTRSFVFCRSTSPCISDDGVPFTYGGMKILECQYGPKREHGKKSGIKTVTSIVSTDKIGSNHEYMASPGQNKKSKQRSNIGATRKKGCQAKISVWRICRLIEYVVTAKKCVTIWQNKAKERLLQDLEAGKEVMVENRFYISLPLQRAHTNHNPCVQSDKAHSVHPQIVQWIDQLVAEGVTTIRDVQAVLKQNVQTRMSDIVAPDKQDRAYYPTLKDIANHIYKAKVKRRISMLDLEPFGRGGGGEAHSAGGEQEVVGIGVDDAQSLPLPGLQLDERHSNSEDTIPRQEVTSYLDEAARKERIELHKELNAIRRSSNKCTDAATLAELKAGIKALHGKLKKSLKEQLLSPSASACAQTPKRKKQDANTATALPPTNRDHEY